MPPQGYPTPALPDAEPWKGSSSSDPNAPKLPNEKAVPDYNDPNSVEGQTRIAPGGDDDAPVTSPFSVNDAFPSTAIAANTEPVDSGAELEEIQQASAQFKVIPADEEVVSAGFGPEVDDGSVPLEEPARLPAAADAKAMRAIPYDYDRKNFRWLQGVVEQDPKDKTWYLMYSVEPAEDDPFGGSITLVDHPALNGLKTDDVVLVKGRIDHSKTDRFGNPAYRIDEVTVYEPDPAYAGP
jgi:hypothetical protein